LSLKLPRSCARVARRFDAGPIAAGPRASTASLTRRARASRPRLVPPMASVWSS
jgi:hypothetical protein